jgi:anti-sigma28 factor (negative regulator of flagellin synthesis)
MKIQNHPTLIGTAHAERGAQQAEAARSPIAAEATGDRVTRSSFANGLSGATPAPLRPEKIAEARAMIASGTLEASIDIDQVVDAILAEL